MIYLSRFTFPDKEEEIGVRFSERQLELQKFIEESARFFGCQFIISTHSPFLLSMKGSRIYDLDENPVDIKRWTQLGNVRAYHDFFVKHKDEFD